jgi:hypothetical protein
MSSMDQWQAANNSYLSDVIAWLRARLERQAAHVMPAPSAPRAASPATLDFATRAPAESASLWTRVFRASPPGATNTTQQILIHEPVASRTLPSPSADPPDEKNLFNSDPAADPQPALLMLGHRLGLSEFELKTLLLAIAVELDTGIAELCARAEGNPSRPYPTFALALSLFDQPAWDALSPDRPLRYWRLIEINQPGAQTLTTSPFRADERIVNYVKGLNYLDDRLGNLLIRIDTPDLPLPDSQTAQVETIVRRLKQAEGHSLPVVQLIGPDQDSKLLVATKAAAQLGVHPYRLPADAVPTQTTDLETFIRLWHRECLLLPVAIYLDAREIDAGDPRSGPVQRLLARTEGILFADVTDVWPVSGRSLLPLDISLPTAAEQRTLWEQSLGAGPGDLPARLAGQFNMGPAAIREAAQTALAEVGQPTPAIDDLAWETCLRRTRPRMDLLARRLEARATWDDIVLPAHETQMLRQIAAQVGQRNKVYDDWGFRGKISRGLGISVLFAGDSGTGKTMAAEVLARDLRLNLYRVDLSAVVSKYIGETEKNLRRLFDAAEDGGSILFFDEADALFGKRSEVKDSHDRYANIEINYLLQRMETYRGLAILATNMKSALDTAFMRRLRFIVNFPFPGPAERKAIWQRAFPSAAPVDALDFDRLARLNLTGGSIRNIVVNAAFVAAHESHSVDMPMVLASARIECKKLDLPINEADFRVKLPLAATA